MKKKVFAFTLLTTLFAINVEGQVDQKTALTKTPHGSEFYQYYDIEKTEEGYSGKKIENLRYISHQNNVLGELSYFYVRDEIVDIKNIDGGPGDLKSDHYTKPSFVHTARNSESLLILDGLIYEFERAKFEDILKGDFKIKYIYVPKKLLEEEKNKSSEKKEEKGGFFKKAKSKVKDYLTPNGITSYIKDRNHEQKIKDYFTEMKKAQKKATENFTAEDKKNIAEIKKIRQKKIDEIDARVAREKEILAERKRQGRTNSSSGGNSDEVIIINETGRSICLVQGGSSTSFTSKESFDCDEPVYWGVTTDGGRNCTSNTKGIAVSAGQCGKEVVLK